MGNEVGVIDTPEILSKEINSSHRILVIGSHGAFAFLSNQDVIDICAKNRDPQGAALAIVDKSYDLMLQNAYEAEDVSVLCMTFDFAEGHLDTLRNDIESLV